MLFTKDSIKICNHLSKKVNDRGFKELNDLYKHLKKIKLLEYKLIKDYSEKLNYNSIENSSFISDNIIKASEHLLNKRELEINIGSITVIININSKEELNNNIINIIVSYIRFICSLTKSNKDRIVLNYYLTGEKKLLEEDVLLGPKEVNSGACSSYGVESKINIWRKEELLKVTIHELFHALCYDEYDDTHDIIEHYQNIYEITSEKVNTREAYAEIWANILNCFLISQMSDKDNYKYFKRMINSEKEFSFFQANKILYTIDNYKDINEKTNILAYFVIRAELYKNFKNFIKFCKNHNKAYVKVNGKKFISFIKKNEIISKDEKSIKNKKSKHLLNIYRLSVNEYKLFTDE